MNFESTKIKTIMMEYFYGKQTTQTQNPQITSNTGKVKCMQYRKANMQDLGLAHSYQSQQKMFFRCDYIKNDLGIIWNQMNIQNKDVLIGNIYVAPGDENQLKILEKELERRRGKT